MQVDTIAISENRHRSCEAAVSELRQRLVTKPQAVRLSAIGQIPTAVLGAFPPSTSRVSARYGEPSFVRNQRTHSLTRKRRQLLVEKDPLSLSLGGNNCRRDYSR